MSFLAKSYAKKGFINPKLKLESDISEKMKMGKTREQVIEELYEEAVKP